MPRTRAHERLVSEGEIEALEQDLALALAANEKRSCNRPILRGSRAPGRADDDIAAILEAQGDLAPCLAAAGDDAIRDVLWRCEPAPSDRCEPLAFDDPAWEGPVLRAVGDRCAALPDAIGARRRACPLPQELDQPPFQGLRRLPWGSGTLSVRRTDEGSLEVTAPAWLESRRLDTIACEPAPPPRP